MHEADTWWLRNTFKNGNVDAGVENILRVETWTTFTCEARRLGAIRFGSNG